MPRSPELFILMLAATVGLPLSGCGDVRSDLRSKLVTKDIQWQHQN
jgi:hypothetical protein